MAALNTNQAGPCLIQYAGLDQLEGFKIEFLQKSNGWYAQLINPDNLAITSDSISNDICVVGGILSENMKIFVSGSAIAEVKDGKVSPTTENGFKNTKSTLKFGDNDLKIAASNFYYNWITEINPKSDNIAKFFFDLRKNHQRILSPDYTLPSAITITDATSMEFMSDKKYSVGKEDGGLLYVAEEGKVCLFGTFDTWNPLDGDTSVMGLHNSQIEKIKLSGCSSS